MEKEKKRPNELKPRPTMEMDNDGIMLILVSGYRINNMTCIKLTWFLEERLRKYEIISFWFYQWLVKAFIGITTITKMCNMES